MAHFPPQVPFVFLTDANAHVGSVQTSAIGGLAPDSENGAAQALHDVLLRLDMAASNTFEGCHSGPSATWVSPQGTTRRLDYVCVPTSWLPATSTCTLPQLELLQTRDDHFPVFASCRLAKTLAGGAFRPPPLRKAMRPTPDWSSGQRLELCRTLAAAPPVCWEVPVDGHYEVLVAQYRTAWASHADIRPAKARQTYLSQETLELVQLRKAYREYLVLEDKELVRRRQLVVLAAFVHNARETVFTCQQLGRISEWFRQLDHSLAKAAAFVRKTGRVVRRAVKKDRMRYLQELRDRVAAQDLKNPKELFGSLRRAFPQMRSSRRTGCRPLPQLQLESGRFAVSEEERCSRWGAYFAEQEAGYAISPEGYQNALAVQRQLRTADAQTRAVFQWDALLSLPELELLIMGQRTMKATGHDGISAELLRLHPPSSASRLLPLMTKTVLALCEPVAFRGGSLLVLAKRAGAATRCTDFRSILVECAPAKLYHKALRNRLVPALLDNRQELQCGAVPGTGIEALALLARAVQDTAAAMGRHWGMLYYDIKAAFYRVVRQLVVAVPETDEALVRLLHTLGLPPAALEELRDKLSAIAALPAAGVSPHATALVSDILQGTYFRVDHSSLIHLTKRGTRAGDPTADLLFGFLLNAFFDAVEGELGRQGLTEELPVLRTEPLTLLPPPPPCLGYASWADDCLRCITANAPCLVLERAASTFQVSLEVATSLGVEFACGPAKTCLMVSARRTPLARTEADAPGVPVELRVRNRLKQEDVVIPLAQVYKHLGCVVTQDRMPRAEILYRHSQALGVVRPLQYRFFSARQFSLAVRRYLLRSLSVSKYTHGCVALTLAAGVHKRLWSQGYIALWRALLRREPVQGKLPHAYEVLLAAQAPSPPLMLAFVRATFLQRHIQVGPSALFWYLQAHWEYDQAKSWLAQLKHDVEAVSQYVPAARVLLDSGNPVRDVLASMHDNPRWWQKCVLQAQKAFLADLRLWHETASNAAGIAVQPGVDLSFPCPLCPAAFRLRRYLCSHMAKRHGVVSPVRHFVTVPWCVACLRRYTSVPAVQNHLRYSAVCLRRAVRVMAPLTLSEIADAEQAHRQQQTLLKKGRWQAFQPVHQVMQMFGPLAPTWDERFPDGFEDCMVADLRRGFRPRPEHLSWIEDYCSQASVIGPTTASVDFWACRPSLSSQVPTSLGRQRLSQQFA